MVRDRSKSPRTPVLGRRRSRELIEAEPSERSRSPVTKSMNEFTYEDEKHSLNKFQQELKEEGVTLPSEMIYAGDIEATLLRFLRARKYNREKSLVMLKDCLQWRQQDQVDQILSKPMPKQKVAIIRQNKPACYVGFDRQGRPIYVDRLGLLNQPEMEAQGVTEDDFITYHIQEMEYMGRILMREASERVGHTVDQVAMIMDLKGITLKHFSKSVRKLMQRMFSIDADNYPETNGGTYVVNIPSFIMLIWRIVEPLLDKRTRAKVQLLRGDQLDKTLLQAFDANMLPTFLGGTIDFDTRRKSFLERVDATMDEIALAAEQRRLAKDTGRSSKIQDGDGILPIGAHADLFDLSAGGYLPEIKTSGSDFMSDDDGSFYTPKSTLSSNMSLTLDDEEVKEMHKRNAQLLAQSQGDSPQSDASDQAGRLTPRTASASMGQAKLPPIGENESGVQRRRAQSTDDQPRGWFCCCMQIARTNKKATKLGKRSGTTQAED